jgi:hypothetical protein
MVHSGDPIDRVTVKVKKSQAETSRTNEDMEQGVEHKKRRRKMLRILFVVAGLVVLILLSFILKTLYRFMSPLWNPKS